MDIRIVGQFSKAFGSKSVWITLNVMFLIGSAGSAYSRNFMQLIASQAISGLGGGLSTLVNIMLHDTVPSDKLGMYMSYSNIILMISFIFGAPCGGYISDTFGWRYCYMIAILPLTLILCLSIYHLKSYDDAPIATATKPTLFTDKLRMVDLVGITLLSIPTVSFVCAISFGGTVYAWSSPIIIAAFAVTLLGYILFFLHQKRWAQYPLLPRALIHDRNFIISCICCLLMHVITGGATATGPQYLMGSLHFSMADAGRCSLLATPGVLAGYYLSGRYLKHAGRFSRLMLTCIAMQTLSWSTMYFWTNGDIYSAVTLFLYILGGIGCGALMVSLAVAAISTLPTELGGTALSMFYLATNVGTTSGIACSSAIIQRTLKVLLPTRIDGPDAAKVIEFIITSIRRVKELSPEIQQIVADVIAIAVQHVISSFILCLVFMFFITLCMQDVSLKKRKA
ncbi:major facilitator superfamily-domain-containing protein [Zychaea mexicana]|uniref:major facilitator superfamily-domain-containing protein n=1 Tax=Zychaea mexicana TaxID=64656 RepID=UPI0022FDF026|nr:major facilitator superfamily-domain-containing protein [Zychaea mexicana]KAI9492107.1 major facilitator superfamily-domain-containing protein [Zychaea mexicana]